MLSDRRWDSHVHLFEFGISGNTPVDDELSRYSRLRAEFGVAAALVVGYEGSPDHVGNNAYVRRLAREHSWIAPVRFAAYGSTVAELEEEFVGHSLYLNDWPLGPVSVRQTFRHLRDTGITSRRLRPIISINATPDALHRHRNSLAQLEGCTIMVSHLGLPGRPAPDRATAQSVLRPLLEVAREIDLVVKLSGVYATDPDLNGSGAAPYVSELLESVGPSRLVWGSDFSPVADASGLEDGFTVRPAIAALFDTRDLEGVMGGNLARLLNDAGFRPDENESGRAF